jgi:hypothetical protein
MAELYLHRRDNSTFTYTAYLFDYCASSTEHGVDISPLSPRAFLKYAQLLEFCILQFAFGTECEISFVLAANVH